MGLGRGGAGGADDALFVGAEDVEAAVHHGLRRVDAAAVAGLAVGEERVGEWVAPAEIVPVINVFGEHHEIWVRLVQPGQDSVCRRAARAAFGSKKLNENR